MRAGEQVQVTLADGTERTLVTGQEYELTYRLASDARRDRASRLGLVMVSHSGKLVFDGSPRHGRVEIRPEWVRTISETRRDYEARSVRLIPRQAAAPAADTMRVVLTLDIAAKDGGALPAILEAASVVADILMDTTKQDSELGWRVILVTTGPA